MPPFENTSFAEIIQSSLQVFIAQSWRWDHFPSFGSLVQAVEGCRTTYGIVYEINTGSMDVGRSPFPYKKTEEQLLAEHPQIFEFLKTTFSCIPFCYEEKGVISYLKPPRPLKIHTFISFPTDEKQKIIMVNGHYMHTIFSSVDLQGIVDDLILSIFAQQQAMSEKAFKELMKKYTLLTGNDYRRIKLFLQRVQSVVTIG